MKASLLVTCIVDQLFPQVGVAVVEVLTRLGVEVAFNPAQTCCGQPAFNSGFRREAREVAARTLALCERELETADYIVAPSGSCTTMVRRYYPELFDGDAEMKRRAERVAGRFFEFSEFLVDVLKVESVGASYSGRVTYHDSCHLLRELGVSAAPRKLLGSVAGVDFVELDGSDQCCGFGGTFAVKYPEISQAITADKVSKIRRSGAETVVACDAGCLMQMAGVLSRDGSAVRCIHLAELLASGGAS
jgi:L-lactate dehydrogenase complex protein LldE